MVGNVAAGKSTLVALVMDLAKSYYCHSGPIDDRYMKWLTVGICTTDCWK